MFANNTSFNRIHALIACSSAVSVVKNSSGLMITTAGLVDGSFICDNDGDNDGNDDDGDDGGDNINEGETPDSNVDIDIDIDGDPTVEDINSAAAARDDLSISIVSAIDSSVADGCGGDGGGGDPDEIGVIGEDGGARGDGGCTLYSGSAASEAISAIAAAPCDTSFIVDCINSSLTFFMRISWALASCKPAPPALSISFTRSCASFVLCATCSSMGFITFSRNAFMDL